jgi:hypothetical protein
VKWQTCRVIKQHYRDKRLKTTPACYFFLKREGREEERNRRERKKREGKEERKKEKC